MRFARSFLVTGLLARSAYAVEDVDTEAARRHFDRGRELYAQQHYADAVTEFREARRISALPALDYNVARCEERLEHWALAADEYERFLAADPNNVEAAPLRTRIAVLRERAGQTHRAWPPVRIAAIVVGGVAVASLAGALGAYFSVHGDYEAKRSACNGTCSDADVASLRSRVLDAEHAAWALWAIAGAAAVTDAALWTIDARSRRRVHASASSLAVRF